jgi:Zn-dependent peptidase ImmA (M78 family)
MSNDPDDFGGTSFSFEQCEIAATELRRLLGCHSNDPLPAISSVLAQLRIDILVRSFDEMGDSAAWAKPDDSEIHMREDIFLDYIVDGPAGRFCAAHELGHICFHKGHVGPVRFFKKARPIERLAFLSDDTSVEETADRIARALFMPKAMVANAKTARDLAQLARVPIDVAVKRIKDLAERNAGTVSPEIRFSISKLKESVNPRKSLGNAPSMVVLKLELWNALPTIAGEDPNQNRSCGSYWIRWSEFGRTTQCGWFIESGTICSYFAQRHS